MRKLLISAAVIALFGLPLSAWAQPDHDRGERGNGSEQQYGAPNGGQHGGPGPQQQHGGPPGGGREQGGGPHGQPGPNPAVSRGSNGGGNSGRPTMTTNPNTSRGPSGGENFGRPATATNPNYSRGPNGGGNFRQQNGPNMASRPGPNRASGGQHDFHGFADFHQNFNASRHFHAGAYRRPAGWYSHHWVYGEYLPGLFWSRNYWLIDFMDYGLPPPPYGAVWVRVGDDALLIDQDSGEIITVEYGVFY